MKRVVFLVNKVGNGGASVLLQHRVTELSKGGSVEPVVVSLYPESNSSLKVIERLRLGGVECYFIDVARRSLLVRLLVLRRFIGSLDASIVHCSLGLPRVLGSLVARSLGIMGTTEIVSANVVSRPGRSWKRSILNRLEASLPQRALAVSQTAAQAAVKNYRMPASKIAVAAPPFDPSPYLQVPAEATRRTEFRLSLGVPSDARLLLSVGRLEQAKGQHLLVQAAAPLLREDEGLYLVIVGSGPAAEDLEALVEETQAQGRIVLVGQRRDVPELLQLCDVYVGPSLAEGFVGYATLEALASAVPVVATALPEVEELVTHGVHAHLVRPNDVEALRDGIRSVLSSSSYASALAEQGRQCVLAFFGRYGELRGQQFETWITHCMTREDEERGAF